MQHVDPDRRAVVAGAGLLALLAAPTSAAGDDAELLGLGALFDEVWTKQAAMESAGQDIEEPWERCREIVGQIEQLSATTTAGLIVKARACSWCHSGEPLGPEAFTSNGYATTDRRLAASILRDLLTIGGKPVPQIT